MTDGPATDGGEGLATRPQRAAGSSPTARTGGRLVANRDLPPQVPVRPQGNVPVIVRIVWSDGAEEWRPARAVRWTSTHVMVSWRDDEEWRPAGWCVSPALVPVSS